MQKIKVSGFKPQAPYAGVSDLVKLPINWVRDDDERLHNLFSVLKDGGEINQPVRMIKCGCGKTYMLEDGGHRISAAYKLYKETGQDVELKVHQYTSSFE